MNKKAQVSPVKLVLALALLIILIVAFTGGGLITLFNIFKFASNVPVWIWIILIVLFIFGGGKKRR